MKAKEKGSLCGLLWYGLCCCSKAHQNFKEAFQSFHQLTEKGNLSGIYWEGACEYFGYGTVQNESSGRKKILFVLTCGDGYWTYCYSQVLLNGSWDIQKNLTESTRLKRIWKTQPISEINYFDPGQCSPW